MFSAKAKIFWYYRFVKITALNDPQKAEKGLKSYFLWTDGKDA